MRPITPPRRARVLPVAVAVATLGLVTGSTTTASALPGLETWIVTLDDVPDATDLLALGGIADAVHGFEHLPAAVVHVDPLSLGLIQTLPGVEGLYPDEDYERLLAESTQTIHADQAWDLGWDGTGVGVAIVDTGIDGTHPDLCAAELFCEGSPVKTVQNVKFLGRESRVDPVVFVEDQVNTDTSSGHGSHVAGIASGAGTGSVVEGKYRGVAPGSHLVGLGVGDAVEAVNVLAAFDWILDNHATYNIKVVNNSWGPGKGTPYDAGHPVNLAVDRMYAAGITTTFGAGNDGPTTDTMNAFSVHPQAISVAGGTKEGHIAFFSSRGVPGSDLWRPDITTPGYQIVAPRASTGFYSNIGDLGGANPNVIHPEDNARYATNSGTSMASPHAAGVVALMQQAAFDARGTWLTPAEVLAGIQRTAVRDRVGGPGGLPNYQQYTMGAGYVNALAAAQAAAAGTDLAPWNDGLVHDIGTFAQTVPAGTLFTGGSFAVQIPVRAGAVSLDVMMDWAAAANDLDIELRNPSGSLVRSTFLGCAPANEPNGYSSFCTNVPNERVNVNYPVEGSWTAIFRGAIANAPADVTGYWSVVVDEAEPVPNPPATTVSLTAEVPVQVVGREVALSLVATDASGAPAAGRTITWSSDGVGTVRGESETHTAWAGGVASATEGTGSQTVTATVDGVSAQVEIFWIGTPVPDPDPDVDPDPDPDPEPEPEPEPTIPDDVPGKVKGHGHVLTPDGVRYHFDLDPEFEPDEEDSPSGKVEFHPHGEGVELEATSIEHFVIDGDHAWVRGTGTIDDVPGHTWTLDVFDDDEDDDNDVLHLVVTAPDGSTSLSLGGVLDDGHLDVKWSREIDGHGEVLDSSGALVAFDLDGDLDDDDDQPSGDVTFERSSDGMVVESTTIDTLEVVDDGGTATGTATVNGVGGHLWSLEVVDRGDPGAGVDELRLVVTAPGGATILEVDGLLTDGDISLTAE